MQFIVDLVTQILLFSAGFVLIAFVVYLYLNNLFKVVRTVQGENQYSIRTILRAIGIFLPLLGVFMGCIKGV